MYQVLQVSLGATADFSGNVEKYKLEAKGKHLWRPCALKGRGLDLDRMVATVQQKTASLPGEAQWVHER